MYNLLPISQHITSLFLVASFFSMHAADQQLAGAQLAHQQLSQAIETSDMQTVRRLTEEGLIDPRLQDDQGNTPLHKAVVKQNFAIVVALFFASSPSSPSRRARNSNREPSDIINNAGKTPADLAREIDSNSDIAKLFNRDRLLSSPTVAGGATEETPAQPRALVRRNTPH